MAVFEGFFNFLSYLTLYHKKEENLPSFLILNTASFFEKNIPRMMAYKRVHLYWTMTRQNCSQHALKIDKEKFQDERRLSQKIMTWTRGWSIQVNRKNSPCIKSREFLFDLWWLSFTSLGECLLINVASKKSGTKEIACFAAICQMYHCITMEHPHPLRSLIITQNQNVDNW